ncbi:MAG: hypothetical protein GX139_03050 [Armatimonadetes bacterium]|nr:hypothetical protein [Armatimonadota bacterium]
MAYVVHDDPTETSVWTAMIIVLAIAVVALIGYIAWTGPSQVTNATVPHQTQITTPGPSDLGVPGTTAAGPEETSPDGSARPLP